VSPDVKFQLREQHVTYYWQSFGCRYMLHAAKLNFTFGDWVCCICSWNVSIIGSHLAVGICYTLLSWILHSVTEFVVFVAEMYQLLAVIWLPVFVTRC